MTAPSESSPLRALTETTPKKSKPKTAKPHAMAFVADEPCTNCSCEWFRPTVSLSGEDDGVACANPWCSAIAQLRKALELVQARSEAAHIVIDEALTVLRDPMTLADAHKGRDTLTRYVVERQKRIALARLARLEVPHV